MNGKDIAQRLLDAILPLAEKMLREYGEFHPYGGMVKASGEIVDVAAELDSGKEGSAVELIALLDQEFKSLAAAGDVVACATVSDVRVKPPGEEEKVDAIRVGLDCSDGYSVEVFKPYSIQGDSEVTFSTLFAQKGRQEVFASGGTGVPPVRGTG